MKCLHADLQLARWIVIACALVTVVFSVVASQIGFRAASRENGPMENTQLVGLALAVLAFAAIAVRTGDADRMVAIGMAVLCTMFFLREADFRSLGPHSWLMFFRSLTFRLAFGGAVVAGLTIYWVRRHDLLPTVFRYSFSRQSWPLWLGGFLLIGSEISESISKRLFHDEFFMFLEELAEDWGFTTLLVAAIWFLRNTFQRT